MHRGSRILLPPTITACNLCPTVGCTDRTKIVRTPAAAREDSSRSCVHPDFPACPRKPVFSIFAQNPFLVDKNVRESAAIRRTRSCRLEDNSLLSTMVGFGWCLLLQVARCRGPQTRLVVFRGRERACNTHGFFLRTAVPQESRFVLERAGVCAPVCVRVAAPCNLKFSFQRDLQISRFLVLHENNHHMVGSTPAMRSPSVSLLSP